MSTPHASGPRSVAAHTIGTAVTGDVIGLPAELLTAARTLAAPPGFTNLPPAPFCVGRADALARLRENLTLARGTAITQASTVHGLGGIGKTTLALEYAHRHRHAYHAIWWLNADSPARIEQSLADLTRRLLPSWGAHAGRQACAAWATAWLQWHPGWLLVFDNVEAVADLSPYLGALDGGHHLITSRRATGWPRTVRSLPLGTLDPDEAAALICATAYGDTAPTAAELLDARVLAGELGHLPLALEQAGAYLCQHPTVTIDAYRRRLAGKLDKAADGLDAERTVARIWTQSLRALEARDPHAVELLRTLAWLAPDDVPVGLLETPGADPDLLHEALGLLAAYSMATVTRHTVGVHRLVQTVLRATAPATPDGPPAGRQAAEAALVRALEAVDPPDPPWDVLMPHLIACAATRPAGHHAAAVTGLYDRAIRYLQAEGHGARTVPLGEAVVAHRTHAFGDLHPLALTDRSRLGRAYRAAGDLGRAVPLLEQVLAQCEQEYGDLHPDTLVGRNNLAAACAAAGDLGRAVPLYELALAQHVRVLGELHPHTLTCRSNLAHAYVAAGDLRRAVPLLEETLAQGERVFGASDPDTLTSRNNLAQAYVAMGEPGRAVPLFEQVLARREETLGDLHAKTLLSRNNLGHAFVAVGRPDRAVPLYERTLAQREQAFGDLHPDTLACRNNLASAYKATGKPERAVPLLELTVAQCAQVFGGTNPHTLTSRNNLASAYVAVGDVERALPLLELTLAQREQVLGDLHPDTLISRGNLAVAHALGGDPDRAVPLMERTAAQYRQVLGPHHPATVDVRDTLDALRADHRPR